MTTKSHSSEDRALTTGQAAEYCFVSPGTILNWIRDGRLACQRTAGGQFRIRADHLRAFMLDQRMSVEALDNDRRLMRQSFCWEFFARNQEHSASRECESCIVRRSRSLNCFELRGHVEHVKVHCQTSCEECPYRRAYAGEGTEAQIQE